MSVILDLGDGINIASDRVNNKSGYLYDHYMTFNSEDSVAPITVNVQLLLKGISDLAVSNYIYFLTHNEPRKAVICNRNVMVECLKVYSVTGDMNYFNFLVGQLHEFWSILSPILFDRTNYQVDSDIKRDLFLHCPHELLPDNYLNNKIFFKQWLSINNDNPISIDGGSQTFTYKSSDKTSNKIFNSTCKNNYADYNIVSRSIVDTSNNSLLTDTLFDGISQYKSTYENEQKNYVNEQSYINGNSNGPSNVYNLRTGKLFTHSYYINNKLEGLNVDYFDDGHISLEEHYHNGIVDGVIKSYYDNEQHTIAIESLYDDGKIQSSKLYYNNGNLYANLFYNYSDKRRAHYTDVVELFSREHPNVMVRKIVYSDIDEPIVDLYFDQRGNVIDRILHDPDWHYDVDDEFDFLSEE